MPFRSKIFTLGIVLDVFWTSLVFALPSAKPRGVMQYVVNVTTRCPRLLCALERGALPLRGRTRAVDKKDIIGAVERTSYTPSGLKTPERRLVTSHAKQMSIDLLRKKILDAVKVVLPQGVRIEELRQPHEITVPHSGFEAHASWPGAKMFRRRVSIPVELVSDGKTFLTTKVLVLLVLETNVLVASRDLQSGTVVTPNDVVWETARLKSPPSHLATAPSEVIGRQISTFVKQGQIFEQGTMKPSFRGE